MTRSMSDMTTFIIDSVPISHEGFSARDYDRPVTKRKRVPDPKRRAKVKAARKQRRRSK